jgi:Cohesin domain
MKKSTTALCMILFLLATTAIEQSRAQNTPTISVDPVSTNYASAYVGQKIDVNLNVTNAQNAWGWNIQDIRFDPQILNITSVKEGPFLKSAGQTFFLWTSQSQSAFSQGDIPEISDALAENTSASGSGTLVTLVFTVLSAGNSPITLNITQIVTSNEPMPNDTETGLNQLINSTSISGSVNIESITSSPSPAPGPNTDNYFTNPFLYVGIVVVLLSASLVIFYVRRHR